MIKFIKIMHVLFALFVTVFCLWDITTEVQNKIRCTEEVTGVLDRVELRELTQESGDVETKVHRYVGVYTFTVGDESFELSGGQYGYSDNVPLTMTVLVDPNNVKHVYNGDLGFSAIFGFFTIVIDLYVALLLYASSGKEIITDKSLQASRSKR
ncbi:MAG: hypothetical protein NC548_10720 [Lachnospiraceae bacterium]|nr:hypothetical protein [Lachnospiraceae bacterium]